MLPCVCPASGELSYERTSAGQSHSGRREEGGPQRMRSEVDRSGEGSANVTARAAEEKDAG